MRHFSFFCVLYVSEIRVFRPIAKLSPRGWCPHQYTRAKATLICVLTQVWTGEDTSHGAKRKTNIETKF